MEGSRRISAWLTQGGELIKRVFAAFAFYFGAGDEADAGAAAQQANRRGRDDDAGLRRSVRLGFETGSQINCVTDYGEIEFAET